MDFNISILQVAIHVSKSYVNIMNLPCNIDLCVHMIDYYLVFMSQRQYFCHTSYMYNKYICTYTCIWTIGLNNSHKVSKTKCNFFFSSALYSIYSVYINYLSLHESRKLVKTTEYFRSHRILTAKLTKTSNTPSRVGF